MAISIALAASLVPIASSPAAAAWVSTAFSADQSMGTQVYVEDLPITIYEDSSPSYLDIRVDTRVDGLQSISIGLAAATGDQLVPGTYTNVLDMFTSPDHMRLAVIGPTVGCGGSSSATVQIAALEWTASSLTTLDLTIICAYPTAPVVIELRLNSNRPITAHGVSEDQIFYPRMLAGTAAPTRTLTVTGHGTTPLQISSLSISGTDASDFSLVSDACTDATLNASETCDVDIGFTPADGPALQRAAWLTIFDNTINGFRRIQLGGSVKRPTTITLTSVNNPATYPGSPTSVVPTVTPLPPHGSIRYTVNGVASIATTSATNPEPWQGNLPGTYTLTATYEGTVDYAASTSAPITQVVRADTSIDIHVDPGAPGTFDVVTYVSSGAGGAPQPGGELQVWDDTAGVMLGGKTLTDTTYLELRNLTFVGTHVLRSTYSGVAPYYLPSTATVSVEGPPPDGVLTAPLSVVATPGDNLAAVSWLPPASDGGSPITGYVVQSSASDASMCETTALHCDVADVVMVGHSYTVRARNALGLGPASAPSNAIVPDISAPMATAVHGSPVSGSSISSSRLKTRLTWSGSDAVSGVEQYELQQSTDSGAWSTISTALTSPALDRLLAVQHTYAFRVRAVDWAGNVGDWVATSARRLTRYSETSGSIRYSGAWLRKASSVFWNGAAKSSSAAGAKATFVFTGRSVAFVSRMGPTKGQAKVYLDGSLVATVDLYAASYHSQRVAWSRTFSSSGRHTVVVKVLGTRGRPRVDIDAFVVGG